MQIIWSDESTISLFGSDGRKYVRRRVWEELRPDYIQATTKNPTNEMIWACMSADGVGLFKGLIAFSMPKNKQTKNIETVLEPKLSLPPEISYPIKHHLSLSMIQLYAMRQNMQKMVLK